MSESCKNNCGCSGKPEAAPETKKSKRQIKIEFLYLDLNECDPCRDSETNVTDALEEIANVLRATGVEIILERIHVESLEQAVALGFKTSPTILINGRDLQLKFEESYCRSCSELSGTKPIAASGIFTVQNMNLCRKPCSSKPFSKQFSAQSKRNKKTKPPVRNLS